MSQKTTLASQVKQSRSGDHEGRDDPGEEALRSTGTGDVVVICSAEPNGAKAFTLRYKAEVKNGVIQGQYGTKDQPGSQSIDGQIEPTAPRC
ncbi:hypothetical protein [Reyranella soli]|uniref:Uncharacterized protein n=1 Tax=Reyranella soli TaxID=1230389 RepID=A0A512NQI5_9HYPH|nr:hypothetical protein [Reyranella soli]GEP61213.1 hypothetical protein RSO01_83790 [Reyranella soli]